MTLDGKKIGFGITSSLCSLNDIIKPLLVLKNLKADIYPVVSEGIVKHSSRFHDKDIFIETVRNITGRKEITTIAEAEPLGPANPMDIMIIAPATGNTIAKLAAGIWDTAVLTAAKATLRNQKPLLLALFTNDALGMNGENIMRLYNTKNIYFVPFGQDDPVKKPTSMTAELALLEKAAELALDGVQIQPSIIARN